MFAGTARAPGMNQMQKVIHRVESEVAMRKFLVNSLVDLRIKVTAPISTEQVSYFVTWEGQLIEEWVNSGSKK